MDPDPLPALACAPLPDIVLRIASSNEDIGLARSIFEEFGQSQVVDFGFQKFEQELKSLPGEYAAPYGAIFLAFVDEQLAGCVALRPLTDCDYANACEMKHLYVRPAFRGFGFGRHLLENLLEYARSTGYSAVLLDTIDEKGTARELYQSFGFEEIPPYYYSPLIGAHYLKVDLLG